MKRSGTVHRMPRVTQPRAWAPTETPAARAEIPPAVWAAIWYQAHADNARRDRNAVLRRHYQSGVDPRDLTNIVHDAGWSVHLNHVKRLVKEDDKDSA